jgi:hypothetical protein
MELYVARSLFLTSLSAHGRWEACESVDEIWWLRALMFEALRQVIHHNPAVLQTFKSFL